MSTLTEEADRIWSLVAAGREQEIVKSGRRILAHLRRKPSLITATVHPLGFVHSKLIANDAGTLRLHLWPVPAIPPQDPPWQVHRHNWSLRSYVLRGAVRNAEYEVWPDSGGAYQLYAVEYEASVSRLRATDERVSCRTIDKSTYEAGMSYEVPVGAFHATVASADESSATLAVAGPETASPPTVLGAADGDPAYAFTRGQLPLDELRRILERVAR